MNYNITRVPLLDRALLFFLEFFAYFIPCLLIFNYGIQSHSYHIDEKLLLAIPFILMFLNEILTKQTWVKKIYAVDLKNTKGSEVRITQKLIRFLCKPATLLVAMSLGFFLIFGGILLFLVFGYGKTLTQFFKRKMNHLFYDKISATEVIFTDGKKVLKLTILILIDIILLGIVILLNT